MARLSGDGGGSVEEEEEAVEEESTSTSDSGGSSTRNYDRVQNEIEQIEESVSGGSSSGTDSGSSSGGATSGSTSGGSGDRSGAERAIEEAQEIEESVSETSGTDGTSGGTTGGTDSSGGDSGTVVRTVPGGTQRAIEEARQIEEQVADPSGPQENKRRAMEQLEDSFSDTPTRRPDASEIDRRVERTVGATRADLAGITDPEKRRTFIESTTLERGEDYTVYWDGNTGRVELTETQRQDLHDRALDAKLESDEVQNAADAAERDSWTFVVPWANRGAFTLEGKTREVQAKKKDGKVVLESNSDERFGDIDWSFGLGGPGDEVERARKQTTKTLFGMGASASKTLFEPNKGIFAESATAEVLEAAGYGETANQLESKARSTLQGAYTTVLSTPALVTAVPGLVMEGSELVGHGAAETAQGKGGEFAEKAGSAAAGGAAGFLNEFAENPYEMTGMIAGSLVGSYGAMSLAARAGPRAGLATRVAIQPGEEILGYGGAAATRGAGRAVRKPDAGKRAADIAFPNNEFLPFSEETAIRAGRAASRKLANYRPSGGRVVDGIREAGARRPRVRVVKDPDAGTVDVTPAAKTQVLQGLEARTPGVPSPKAGIERLRAGVESKADAARGRSQSAAINTELELRSLAEQVGDIDIREVSARARRKTLGVAEGAKTRATGRVQSAAINTELEYRALKTKVGSLEPAAVPRRVQGRIEELGDTAEGRAQSAAINTELKYRGLKTTAGRVRDAPGRAKARLEAERNAAKGRTQSAVINRQLEVRALMERADQIDPGAVPRRVRNRIESATDAARGRAQSGAINQDLELRALTGKIRDAGNRNLDIRDYTIRVEPGRPPRRVDAEQFDGGDSGGPAVDLDDLPQGGVLEIDATDAEGSGQADATVTVETDAGDAGGGQRMVGLQKMETTADGRTGAVEVDTETDTTQPLETDTGRRYETNVNRFDESTPQTTPLEAPTRSITRLELQPEVGQTPTETPTTGEIETEIPGREIGFETDGRTEPVELGFEAEYETALEAETETETEFETEVEMGNFEGPRLEDPRKKKRGEDWQKFFDAPVASARQLQSGVLDANLGGLGRLD